jgi:hypothetical protein
VGATTCSNLIVEINLVSLLQFDIYEIVFNIHDYMMPLLKLDSSISSWNYDTSLGLLNDIKGENFVNFPFL